MIPTKATWKWTACFSLVFILTTLEVNTCICPLIYTELNKVIKPRHSFLMSPVEMGSEFHAVAQEVVI